MDGSGNAYVTGETDSANFPTTPGAFDTTYSGGTYDAFVTKLNASGSASSTPRILVAQALIRRGLRRRSGIAVDGSGNAYVTGVTDSTDFPTTPGAFDTTLAGGDAFVTKLTGDGSASSTPPSSAARRTTSVTGSPWTAPATPT